MIPLIVAWIVLSGTVALVLFLIDGGPDTVATGGPNLFDGNYDNYIFDRERESRTVLKV